MQMKKFTEITNKLTVYVSYLSMVSVIFIMLYMTLDVILRHVFNSPIKGGYEMTTLAMVVLIFTSWSYTQTVNGHIHVTMLIRALPRKPRFIIFAITSMFSAAVIVIATYAAFLQMLYTYEKCNCTGMLLIPHWPFILVECIALGYFALILLRDAIRAIMAIFNEELAQEIESHWA